MKKLQNNFTTQEQSKRLLELGVPADSADCCLRRILTDGGYCETWRIDVFDFIGQIHDDYLPCWSVGRLIDIICNCHVITNQLAENWIRCDKNTNLIELLIKDIEVYINVQHMDFSKLEE